MRLSCSSIKNIPMLALLLAPTLFTGACSHTASGSAVADTAALYTFYPNSVPDEIQATLRPNFEVGAKFIRSAVAGDGATMQALFYRPKVDSTNFRQAQPKLDSAGIIKRYQAHGPIDRFEYSLFSVNAGEVWVAGHLYLHRHHCCPRRTL